MIQNVGTMLLMLVVSSRRRSAMPLASDTHGRPLSKHRVTEPEPKPAGVNKNTNWLSSTGAWAFYVGLIALLWLVVSLFVDPGLAWTWVNIIHGVLSFYLFHWVKVCACLTAPVPAPRKRGFEAAPRKHPCAALLVTSCPHAPGPVGKRVARRVAAPTRLLFPGPRRNVQHAFMCIMAARCVHAQLEI